VCLVCWVCLGVCWVCLVWGGKLYQFLADTTLNQSVDILAHLCFAASAKLRNSNNPLGLP